VKNKNIRWQGMLWD